VLLTSFVLVYGCKRVVLVRLCIGIAWEYQGNSSTIQAIAIGRVMFRSHPTQWWAVPTLRPKLGTFFPEITEQRSGLPRL
jgi:hypothetical protein